jgi:hypothetical protein
MPQKPVGNRLGFIHPVLIVFFQSPSLRYLDCDVVWAAFDLSAITGAC